MSSPSPPVVLSPSHPWGPGSSLLACHPEKNTELEKHRTFFPARRPWPFLPDPGAVLVLAPVDGRCWALPVLDSKKKPDFFSGVTTLLLFNVRVRFLVATRAPTSSASLEGHFRPDLQHWCPPASPPEVQSPRPPPLVQAPYRWRVVCQKGLNWQKHPIFFLAQRHWLFLPRSRSHLGPGPP